jgi:hypothetical protein
VRSPKVVSVNTAGFIVCNGSTLNGVGSIEVPEEVVTASVKDVSEVVRALGKKGSGGD